MTEPVPTYALASTTVSVHCRCGADITDAAVPVAPVGEDTVRLACPTCARLLDPNVSPVTKAFLAMTDEQFDAVVASLTGTFRQLGSAASELARLRAKVDDAVQKLTEHAKPRRTMT